MEEQNPFCFSYRFAIILPLSMKGWLAAAALLALCSAQSQCPDWQDYVRSQAFSRNACTPSHLHVVFRILPK